MRVREWSTSRCPSRAAYEQITEFHSQPFPRAQRNISSRPAAAAFAHVSKSHSHPLARAHFSSSRCPPRAAFAQVLYLREPLSTSHGVPIERSHFNITKSPRAAASLHVWARNEQPRECRYFRMCKWPCLAAAPPRGHCMSRSTLSVELFRSISKWPPERANNNEKQVRNIHSVTFGHTDKHLSTQIRAKRANQRITVHGLKPLQQHGISIFDHIPYSSKYRIIGEQWKAMGRRNFMGLAQSIQARTN